MRIAVIGIRGIPASYGGFEVTAENVLERLVAKGHEATIYCRGSGKGKPKEYKGMRLLYHPSIELKHMSTFSHALIASLDCIFRKFDVVFAFNVGIAIQVVLLRIFGKKSVLFVDGLDWKREKYGWFGRRFLKISERIAAKVAAKIVVDALPAQKHYFEAYGRQVECIPSGAEIVESTVETGVLSKLGLSPKNYVAIIGRLTPEKRQHLVAETFKKIKTDMKLVIVGGNPYSPEYVEKVKNAAKGDDRIIMTGPIYGKEVDELYFNAAIFVNASTLEGTSLSILQAMGSGCALIVSNIPENLAAVYDAALIFDANSAEDFREKFQLIVDDARLRAELSDKAKKVIEKYYSWNVAANKFEELFWDVCKKR